MDETEYQREVTKKIAKKHGLSHKETKDIVYSQFNLVRDTIAKGNYDKVLLAYLGTFYTTKERIYQLKKDADGKNKGDRGNEDRDRDTQDQAKPIL